MRTHARTNITKPNQFSDHATRNEEQQQRKDRSAVDSYTSIQCESNPHPHPPPSFFYIFSKNGLKFLVQILHTDYTFLSTLDYKFLFNYLQLWQSYAILSATTIICSKCPPSAETHAGWSHLI